MLRALFWDMDDTLLLPRDPSPLRDFKLRYGLPLGELVLKGVQQRPPEERALILEEFLSLERRLSATSELRPGIQELLRSLKAQGYFLALITNNHRASARIVLERHALHFDLLLTREDGDPKPSPDLLYKALRLGGWRPEEVLYIGDSPHDGEAAQAAGIPCWFLATPFNEGLKPRFARVEDLAAALSADSARASGGNSREGPGTER
jgi:HAD superfamily hydrolase (TIGR01509 family)